MRLLITMLVVSTGVLFAEGASVEKEAVVQQVAKVSSKDLKTAAMPVVEPTVASRMMSKSFWMQPAEKTQSVFIYSSVIGGPKPDAGVGVLYRDRFGFQGFDVSVTPLVGYVGAEAFASYNLYLNTKYLQPYVAVGAGVVSVAQGEEVAGVFPVIIGLASKNLFADVIVYQRRLPMKTYIRSDLSLAQSVGRLGVGFQF